MRAQLRAFTRDLRTTHLYLVTYVVHISPPLNNLPVIQTEHSRAGRLNDPGMEANLVGTQQSKGRVTYLTLSSKPPKSVFSAESVVLS
jgi:hypothetical protein